MPEKGELLTTRRPNEVIVAVAYLSGAIGWIDERLKHIEGCYMSGVNAERDELTRLARQLETKRGALERLYQ